MVKSVKNIFALIIVLLLLIRGVSFFSSVLNNIGIILYNNWLILPDTNAAKVLNMFSEAVDMDPTNQRAWRNLGFYYLSSLQEDQAMLSWSSIDKIDNELFSRGQLAEDERKYEDALLWYRLTQDLSPELGDPSYKMGRIYHIQENWELALEAYQEATQKDIFYQDSRSDAYFQQGMIYQHVPEYQNVVLALEMYSLALEIDRFSDEIIKAEAFYKRGEISEWLTYELEETIADYQEALAHNPMHVPARLRLGYNLYWLEKDVSKAEFYIQPAIEIWNQQENSNLDWAYRLLGDVYFDAGLMPEAKLMYESALDLKPQNQYLQDQLEFLGNKE